MSPLDRDADAAGKLSTRRRERMSQLRRLERNRATVTGERTLQFGLSEIDRMGSALGVPRLVREVAEAIYRQAVAEDLLPGRSIESVATVALYVACWKENVPHTLDEIAGVSRVECTNIGRTYLSIAHELNLAMRSVDPKAYVPRLCSTIGLADTVETTANEIIDATTQDGLPSGTSSIGFAAGAIYLATSHSEETVTQEELASVAQVTTVTIRKHYQAQVAAVNSAPDQWLNERQFDRCLDNGL